jgi:hypothetical protein
MTGISEYARVTAWLRQLPPNAVIEWNDISMDSEQPFGESYIDVVLSDAARNALGLAWVWTILAPDDPALDEIETADALTILVPPDVDVYHLMSRANGEYIATFWKERDAAFPQTIWCRLNDLARQFQAQLIHTCGWSARRICGVLERWAAEHCGRPDIRFQWNARIESPDLRIALDRLSEPRLDPDCRIGSQTYVHPDVGADLRRRGVEDAEWRMVIDQLERAACDLTAQDDAAERGRESPAV